MSSFLWMYFLVVSMDKWPRIPWTIFQKGISKFIRIPFIRLPKKE